MQKSDDIPQDRAGTKCLSIQQIVNETDFAVRKTVVVQHFARFNTNLGNLRISQDISYVGKTDSNDLMTIFGNRANLWNNNAHYVCVLPFRD